MKKAKQLLAVLLAFVMLLSAACLPTYGYVAANNNWHNPTKNPVERYYFTYGQAAGWLLDLLEELLADANLIISCTDLNEMTGIGINIFTGNAFLNMDDPLEKVGMVDSSGEGAIRLDTVDNTVKSLYAISKWIEDPGSLGNVANGLNLLGDLLNKNKGLGVLIGQVDKNLTRANVDDTVVLEHLIHIITSLAPMIRGILGGTVDAGSILGGTLDGLLQDFLSSRTTLKTVGDGIKDLIYRMLVNSEADIIGDGSDNPDTAEDETITTVDQALQKVVDWLLIEGTGENQYDGGYSMVGMNAEPLMPAIGDQPGGAALTGITIQSDQDLDGALENHTMSFYQLVNNAVQGLLSGMLADLLADLLYDALDVEITEEFPMGDPAVMEDVMFNTILGAVEGLCVQNGAPALDYEAYPNTDTPKGKIDALVSWFLDKRTDGQKNGLSTFIEINFKGFHIQDNFMSLLNDIARLAINLLPGLGVFEDSADLGYTADELNEYYAYDENFNIVHSSDDTKVDSLYVTYETGKIVYVDTYVENADGTKTPEIYCYYPDKSVVNTTNSSAANYVNPSMIRQYYVISTKQVYACLVKMLLDDIIDGCYFPEWADDIPSVLAYGLASLAAPLLPENNYFERLDAYYNQQTMSSNGDTIEPIPYTVEKTIKIKNMDGSLKETKTITVPIAALNIGASYLAAYLNSVLDRDTLFDTNTSLEKFACEIAIWGFTKYMPAFTGETNATTGLLQTLASTGEEGVFQAETNALIQAVYANPATGEWMSDDANAACFDGIYDLIDQTVFKLLPSSWLPSINGSQQLILEWLLGNLCEFDLQGILGLLSVNEDSRAELHQPVLTIILRIIDRVLALVFNDSGILIPGSFSDGTQRRGVVENGNITSLTSLDALLDCNGEGASLPTFVYNLLRALEKYKTPILATALPLIASSKYERPYDTEYLGRKGIAYYKLADLNNYTDALTKNINANFLKTFDNEADAKAAVKGDATASRQENGTYNVVLNNGTVFGSYPDIASANVTIGYLKNAYYTTNESDEVDDNGKPIITGYSVYAREDYYSLAATVTEETDTKVDYGKQYSTYSDFSYASFYPRNASSDFASYGLEYQSFEIEDFATTPYLRTNVKSAIKSASSFGSSYKSFTQNDLPDAYGSWMMYSIRTQLKTRDLYDANDDGVSVLTTSDTDYIAPTTDANGVQTDPGKPVDGNPRVPDAMYPFSSTSSAIFPFVYNKTGETISTESMNMFNATNYEQIAMAVAYGEDSRNDVTLGLRETEDVIRLAINSVNFDITPNADGSFHSGHANWSTLTSAQWASINSWMAANDFTIEAKLDANGAETGEYIVKRPAFRLLDSNFNISVTYNGSQVSSTPLLETDSTYRAIREIRTMQDKSYEQELIEQIHASYKEYIAEIYTNRNSLYNTIDTISWRLESAELARSKPMENAGDLVILDWALANTRNLYMGDAGRNYHFTGELVNGVAVVEKVYTSTSYSQFQKAYEFAQSLRNRVVASSASTNEITQSMITLAYQGILDAARKLVLFTGFADWTQLDSYIAMAEEILTDPYRNDSVLGYASGLDVLEDMYKEAMAIRKDETIDCESQNRVDTQASLLNSAIQNLVFNTVPSILPSKDTTSSVETVTVSNINNRLVGHVFGLEEGTGISEKLIAENGELTIAGMTIDEDIGSDIQMNPSGRGNGTGAYFSGRVRTLERFRYIAVIYGDINGDTRIDGSDASYIQYYISSGQNNETDMGTVKFEAADANHDNVVNADDIVAIQDHYTFKQGKKIDQTTHRDTTVA